MTRLASLLQGVLFLGVRWVGLLGRCKISGRAWQPEKQKAHKRRTAIAGVFLCLTVRVMAAVRGRPRACQVPFAPVFQPAYSCHPFAWKRTWPVVELCDTQKVDRQLLGAALHCIKGARAVADALLTHDLSTRTV